MSERELRFKARMMAKEKAPKNPIETPFRSTETLPPYSSPHKNVFERSPDALQNLEIGAIVQEGYFQTPGGSGLRIVQSMAHPIDAYDQGSTGLSPRSDEDGTIHGNQESLIKSGNSPIKESQRVKNGQKIVDFFQNDPASRHSSQSDLINHSETEDSLQCISIFIHLTYKNCEFLRKRILSVLYHLDYGTKNFNVYEKGLKECLCSEEKSDITRYLFLMNNNMENDVDHYKRENDSGSGKENSLTSVYTISRKVIKKEYDPYQHREVKHPTTYFETLIHLMKCSMGTGILAMPNAFSNAGYLLGTVGTFFMGFLCTYTVHILIASEYELCKRYKKPSMLYPETAEAAISEGPGHIKKLTKYAPFLCNLFLLMYEIGSCGVYVVFISTNLKDVVDHYQSPEDRYDIRLYCVFIFLPLLLINSIRNYKYLAPLSTVATILTGISFAILFYYLFSEMPDITERYAVAPVERVPLFFGTVVFAIEAMGVVFPLENEMKNPKKFRGTWGVLNCAMIPITILYTCVGLLGFLRYGEDVSGSITLSLPQDEILSQAVRVLLAIAIFITHALLLHPAIDILWYDYFKQHVKQNYIYWEYLVRFTTVFITFALAVAVPYLELFISLIGALCLSMLGLMFPAIIETCTFWDKYKGIKFALFILKNVIIAVIAAYGLGFGVESSIKGMIERFSEEI